MTLCRFISQCQRTAAHSSPGGGKQHNSSKAVIENLRSMSRRTCLSFAPALLVLLVVGAAHVQGFSLGSIIGDALGGTLKRVADNAHKSDTLELFEHTCEYTVYPYFKKWEIYYKANVFCPGWVPYRGQYDDSRSSSKSQLIATQDLVRQLVAGGQITEQDAKVWLDQKV
ncbi:unnamed protein product [Meganyctiphanes norvegica]|uniref:Anti-lipopolysaccharide factor n=1 Tax=Meganyctiphanes norvegica TaxID=48144 RepID=A0AAV2RB38_MEGNR